jgi:hypothetical protein
MAALQHVGAAAPGPVTPTGDDTKDEAPTGYTAQGFWGQTQDASPDSYGEPHAGQALRVIEGEGRAAAYLARLRAQQADPDELALIVSMLDGARLRGFCRVIVKALGVRHA